MKKLIYNKCACVIVIMTILLYQSACKKIVEVDGPATSINSDNVFSRDGGAIQVVTGLYAKLSNENYFSSVGIGLSNFKLGLYSDELTLFDQSNADLQRYYLNNFSPTDATLAWRSLYEQIAYVNDAISGMELSTSLSPAIKKQLLGECKFLRAFSYFYLVNLYGPIPMPLNTDFEKNRLLSRSTTSEIYNQIILDLIDAKSMLNSNYLSGTLLGETVEKVRPNKATATALLARAYLYSGDFGSAETQASEIINGGKYSLRSLDDVFLKNSDEVIWSIQPVKANGNDGYNAPEGSYFILPSTGPNVGGNPSYPFYVSNKLVGDFEPGDDRKSKWLGSVTTSSSTTYYYPNKYKALRSQTSVNEYDVVFRLGEQYLIRSEARARQGKLFDAVSDLNVIRTRARALATTAVPNPLPNLSSALQQSQVFIAIEHERQVELFTEWGARWFDMNRMPGFSDPTKKRTDELMPAIAITKGSIWSNKAKLFPIPQSELDSDPNLSQNEGY